MRILIINWIVILAYSVSLPAQIKEFDIDDYPIEVSVAEGNQDILVVYITGDGGWNKFSHQVSESFTKLGYSVVSLNARKYFWDAKKPEVFTKDVERIVTHYLSALHKSSYILVGYSFGADAVAFLPNRLPMSLLKRTLLVALISPSASTDFVVRIADLVSFVDSTDGQFKVGEEIKASPISMLCIFGEEEDLILKRELKNQALVKIVNLPGSHRYNDEGPVLVNTIINHLKKS